MADQQTLGAYYQCHKNAASFIRTIKSFQKYYSTSTIVVTNDGGYNYEKFCLDNNIYYTYISKKSPATPGLMFDSYNQSITFLKNLWNSFKIIKEDYIILLEDDVRILKKHMMPFNYSINGCNMNEKLPKCCVDCLLKNGYTGPLYYGGCGGTVLDKNFFKAISIESVELLLEQFSKNTEMFASDILLSFIALYYGGSIGQFSEFAETWYIDIRERYESNMIAFLHQYKNDYERYNVYPNKDELLELKNYI